jgi:tRNA-specific 2-thiouridylase
MNSQDYFLGLVDQQALARSVFPLGEYTRTEARKIVASAGLGMPDVQSSQDVCFIGQGGYVSFIESYAGYRPEPGAILDVRGRTVGFHKGALRYTVGQRKGLGIGLGRRVYVLAIDALNNTITVGDLRRWPYHGFSVPELNFMKAAELEQPLAVNVKVRYRQDAQSAVLHPAGKTGAWVEFKGLYAPGQLAVFYDHDGAVLCAGIIEHMTSPP